MLAPHVTEEKGGQT